MDYGTRTRFEQRNDEARTMNDEETADVRFANQVYGKQVPLEERGASVGQAGASLLREGARRQDVAARCGLGQGCEGVRVEWRTSGGLSGVPRLRLSTVSANSP